MTDLPSQRPRYKGGDHNSRQRAAIASGSVVTTVAEVQAQPGRLIDRYGHEHSEAIFRNWTPAAIKAMGIRRVGGEPKGGAE